MYIREWIFLNQNLYLFKLILFCSLINKFHLIFLNKMNLQYPLSLTLYNDNILLITDQKILFLDSSNIASKILILILIIFLSNGFDRFVNPYINRYSSLSALTDLMTATLSRISFLPSFTINKFASTLFFRNSK